MNKILIADNISSIANKIFEENKLAFDIKIGLSEDELVEIIPEYSALLIRSGVTVTKTILDNAKNLKVIGRPGVGVDNIDLPAASDNNVIVMNTPLGNVQATAELTFALIQSLYRKITDANRSMHENRWDKKLFVGSELSGKNIVIVGFGNVGKKISQISNVYDMNVFTVSDSISEKDEQAYNVKKISFAESLKIADIITFHNKLSPQSKHMINSEAISQMKDSAIVINCARGGIVSEKDMKEALQNNNISGYGVDVYENEPEIKSIFTGMKDVVMTPHIGASTSEAQEKVAKLIAEQIVDCLLHDKVNNQVK